MENTLPKKNEIVTRVTFYKNRHGTWIEDTSTYVPEWDQTIIEFVRIPRNAKLKSRGFCIIADGYHL